MVLSLSLSAMRMTYRCPSCGQAFDRKGSWFKAARRFKCTACQADATIGYDDKLRLFSRYRDAAESQAGAAHDSGGGPETPVPDAQEEPPPSSVAGSKARPAKRAPHSAAELDGEADRKEEPGNGADDKPVTREDLDFVPIQHFG